MIIVNIIVAILGAILSIVGAFAAWVTVSSGGTPAYTIGLLTTCATIFVSVCGATGSVSLLAAAALLIIGFSELRSKRNPGESVLLDKYCLSAPFFSYLK